MREIWPVLQRLLMPDRRDRRLDELAERIDRHSEELEDIRRHVGLAGAVSDIAGELKG